MQVETNMGSFALEVLNKKAMVNVCGFFHVSLGTKLQKTLNRLKEFRRVALELKQEQRKLLICLLSPLQNRLNSEQLDSH